MVGLALGDQACNLDLTPTQRTLTGGLGLEVSCWQGFDGPPLKHVFECIVDGLAGRHGTTSFQLGFHGTLAELPVRRVKLRLDSAAE